MTIIEHPLEIIVGSFALSVYMYFTLAKITKWVFDNVEVPVMSDCLGAQRMMIALLLWAAVVSGTVMTLVAFLNVFGAFGVK